MRFTGAAVLGVLVMLLSSVPSSSVAASPGGADLCAAVADEAGFTGEPLVTAVAVGLAESGCDPLARGVNGPTPGCPGGSVDRGLWQMNGCYSPDVSDACAYDAACNGRVAYRLSAGGTTWKPWSSFNNGRHLSFLTEARATVQRLGRAGVALIQSRFGTVGNFELVYPAVGGGIRVMWRNNDAPGNPWSAPSVFGPSLGPVDGVTMIQSSYGNLEVVARVAGSLYPMWRDSGPTFNWNGPSASL